MLVSSHIDYILPFTIQVLTTLLDTLPLLHTWKGYSALVRSLELSLDPDQEVLNDLSWDEFPMRDISEKLCLMFISQLVSRFDAEKLVKAKFVEKWLAKQNWGMTDEEREINFVNYLTHRSNRISDIITAIQNTRSGREALNNAKLFSYGRVLHHLNTEIENSHVNLLLSINVGGDTNDDLQNDSAAFLARTLRGLEAGDNLRQRHREAMVLNDGTHPVNRDDIIQRDRGTDN